MTTERTPRKLTEREARAVAAIARSGVAYCSPRTFNDIRRAFAVGPFLDEPELVAPFGVRLIVQRAMPDGYLLGGDGTRLDWEVVYTKDQPPEWHALMAAEGWENQAIDVLKEALDKAIAEAPDSPPAVADLEWPDIDHNRADGGRYE